jgi:hypothetical protein
MIKCELDIPCPNIRSASAEIINENSLLEYGLWKIEDINTGIVIAIASSRERLSFLFNYEYNSE